MEMIGSGPEAQSTWAATLSIARPIPGGVPSGCAGKRVRAHAQMLEDAAERARVGDGRKHSHLPCAARTRKRRSAARPGPDEQAWARRRVALAKRSHMMRSALACAYLRTGTPAARGG